MTQFVALERDGGDDQLMEGEVLECHLPGSLVVGIGIGWFLRS